MWVVSLAGALGVSGAVLAYARYEALVEQHRWIVDCFSEPCPAAALPWLDREFVWVGVTIACSLVALGALFATYAKSKE
jgi:hypothetical protein